jgi:dTDP-4-dehydrorhamnose reductase
MAGHVAALRLSELGHEVIGFERRPLPWCETIIGDAMEADLPRLVQGYDAAINCIGILNKAVDAAPHVGIWLNSYLPHLLAAHAKRVIHLSTDCVFSGHEGGGYTETSFRSADTLYGRSKTLGELDDGRNLTIRTSIVGPDTNENGIGLFNWFMKQGGAVNGYTKAIWGGVTTIALAEAMHAALEQGLAGLIHLTNGQRISKFELLKLFNGLRDEPVEIIPSGEANEDKSLVCGRDDFGFRVESYEEMVKAMGEWMRRRGTLYPHCNIWRSS